MELRSLVDVDLREVLAPINRSARGEFVPALRTAAGLRERAGQGVLDLGLSRACFVGGTLGGACLVDRLRADDAGAVAPSTGAQIDALAADSLAQQRGALRALIESVQTATADAGVEALRIIVSEMDSALLGLLAATGFVRRGGVERYTLSGAPTALPLPTEVAAGTRPDATDSSPWVRPVAMADVAGLLGAGDEGALLFSQRPSVLARLSARLTVLGLSLAGDDRIVAAAVADRERKLLLSLAGQGDALSALVYLLCLRHGVQHVDAIQPDHPGVAALGAVGFQRTAVRIELVCDPRAVVAERRARAAAAHSSSDSEKGS